MFPHLNVNQNILFGLTSREIQNEERIAMVRKIIGDLGIDNLLHRRIDGLSGGELQKVSLAQMLVRKPKIILLDEPLSHLDPPTRDKLRIELRTILKSNVSLLFMLLILRMMFLALADSVSILNYGRLEGTGDLEQILNSSQPSSSFLSHLTLVPIILLEKL